MTQELVLRGEMGARAWRVCGQAREDSWANAGGVRCLGESAQVRPRHQAAALAPELAVKVGVGPYFAIFFAKFRPFFEEKKIREI
jgi:hypothetical protein